MKKVVYPFDETFLPILRILSQTNLEDKISIVSPRGWGLAGKRYTYGQKTYIVKTDFEKESNECSEIFIVNSRFTFDIKKDILPLIKNIHDKNIIISKIISIDEKREIYKSLKKCKVIYTDNEFDINIEDELNDNLFNHNVPIIFVAGITEETNKFKVQLELYSELCSKGYNVGILTSRAESMICGIPTLPSFLYDKQIAIRDKIILLNQLIKEYELSIKPDILIIGIPGEVLLLNNYYIGNGGIIAYIISQAVKADGVVLCSMYNQETSSSLTNISEKITQRLGSKVKYNIVVNRILDYESIEETNRIQYLTLPHEFVLSNNENYNDDIYFSFLDEDIKRMTNDIIEDLSE